LLAYLFQWFLFVFPSGTSPFSELAAQTGHCFDLAVEAAVSGGLVLIQRHAEIGKRGVIQGGAEEVSISFSSRSVVSAKGEIAEPRRLPDNWTKRTRLDRKPCLRVRG
jgi:hypothetical protein